MVYEPPEPDQEERARRAEQRRKSARKRAQETPAQREQRLEASRRYKRKAFGGPIRCTSERGAFGKHMYVEPGQVRHSETCLRCGVPNTSRRVH